jgi:hypothetical protein
MSKAKKISLSMVGLVVCAAAFAVGNAVAEDAPSSAPPIVAIDGKGQPISCPGQGYLEFSAEALLAADAQRNRDGVVADGLSGEALPRCADGSVPDGAEDVAGARQTSE